jgi:hypothetical protein
MKIYEIKIGKKSGEKTFWKTIGTIFCADTCKLHGDNGKPATFVLDFPEANGIVVKKLSKEEYEAQKAARAQNAEQDLSNDFDNPDGSGRDGCPI